MPSNAKVGLGVAIQIGDGGSPEQFATIAEVPSFDGPNETMEFVDKTTLQSTGGYREWLPHLKDGGEVTIPMRFDPTHPTQDGQTGLKQKYNDRDRTNFRIDCGPAGVSIRFDFAAYVQNVGLAVAVDNLIERPVTLKVDGPVVETMV